jgi:hypothetical protein
MAVFFATATLTGCLAKDGSETGFTGGGQDTLNSPPVISGNPQTAIMMGDSYSFTPTASDPDGDSLTFSVQNLPDWVSFDSPTGRIAGQPSLVDVGVFERIVISVSDGIASASLGEFSITVSQGALGSMTLSWTPPTQNTDGTALTDLAGYRIYYGISQGNYPNRVVIDTAGITSYIVDNLVPNTYYVVATSINSFGIESAYSNVAVNTVQ